jgi:hypothetical protein
MRVMGNDEDIDPSDPDFISEEGTGTPFVGDAFPSRTTWGSPTPVFVPKASTPLHEDMTDVPIPTFALWSMKYLRHAHLFGRADADIREVFGQGEHAIYVLDDDRKHCLVSREVGRSPDGCIYCLVAQIPIATYDELVDGAPPDSAFADARSFTLCTVFEAQDGVSNVAVSERYKELADVPPEYLPPNPPLRFGSMSEE